MKRFFVNWKCLAAMTAAFAVGASAQTTARPAPKISDFLPDPVIAKAKGFEIKQSELDSAMANVKADALSSQQEIPADQLPGLETRLFVHILQIHLIKPKVTDADKAKAKEEADKRLEFAKKQFPNEEGLNRHLKSRGMTPEEFRMRLLDETTWDAVLHSKVTVTDAQVKKFYDDNPSQFEEPEMVKINHIMMRTRGANGTDLSPDDMKAKRKRIDELLKRAKAGEDFAKLAKENTDDLEGKETGGEMRFARGTGQIPPEFEAAAFSLKPGQISDVVTTVLGYHIMKLAEKIPAKKVDFEKVSSQIRMLLEKQEIDKILPKYYADLKKEMDVEITDDRLKSMEAELVALIAKEQNKPKK